jgi:hypothetical protein
VVSLARYGLGASGSIVVVVALATTAVTARRRLVPTWLGPWARLAEVTIATSTATVAAQLLGLAGELHGITLASMLVAVACAVVTAAGRSREVRTRDRRVSLRRRPNRAAASACAGAVVMVAATWMTGAGSALDKGIYDFDSLVYHGPFAARFAATGVVRGLHQITTGQAIAYHPATAELLHAVGIVYVGTDVLTPLANFAWLAVLGLAAWCFGCTWRRPESALLAVAVIAAAPGVVSSQAGTAGNDIAASACFLAAMAFSARAAQMDARQIAPGEQGGRLLAALAAGLAVSIKLSVVVPVAALLLLAVARSRPGTRRVAAAAWSSAFVVTGGFWYMRNLAVVGNPLPAVRIGIGPFALPRPSMPIVDRFSDTVLGHLTRDRWRMVYEPGLHRFLGPLWWVVLLAATAGVVAALVQRRDRPRRGVALVVVASAIGYAATPTAGAPIVFEANLRYALPFLLPALILASTALSSRVGQGLTAAVGIAAVIAAVTSVHPWRAPEWTRAAAVVVAGVALIAVTAAFAERVASRRLVAVGVVAVLAVGLPAAFRGVEDRYLSGRYATAEGDLGVAFRWSRGVHHERIGLSGVLEQYPLFGPTLDNTVQYVGRERSDTSYEDFTSCRDWRAAVDDGHYTYLVISRAPLSNGDTATPREARWAANDPTLRVIESSGATSVWRVLGPRTEAAC